MTSPNFVDTVLLLALPASGKSEIRRYMMHVDRAKRIEQFHLADTVQLDDYPYVELMREIDDALEELGEARRFFKSADDGFQYGHDWGTLLQLVNEDYRVMKNPDLPSPKADAAVMFARIDAARAKVGVPAAFESMSADLRKRLGDRMQKKVEWVVHELFGKRPNSLENKTIVIEFARGGPQGSTMPLQAPHGYQYSLAQLAPEILEKAAVLYVWVEPEESRRKNLARAVPNAENTILFHAAPESVMINDYGCDDMAYLMETSKVPNTITIHAGGKDYFLPIGRFDNRVDKTTFVRDEPSSWDPKLVAELHAVLADGLSKMWSAHKTVRKL
ncbi:MAG TPA: hypothetical protein PLJ27_05160 [Polyangiaceae bacterium]|nr:hypothetical protein [Polyangiaceae bacterium]